MKITQIKNDILFASSGPVSLGQQIGNIFNVRQGNIRTALYFEEIPRLQEQILKVIAPALHSAQMAAPLLGQHIALMDALCGCVFAAPFHDGMKLVEITPQAQFQFSYLNDKMPFTCLGSGKASADPFLRFLFSVYWEKRLPTLEGGALTAYWTVKAAIEAASPNVGLDIDVAVLSGSGKSYSSKLLAETDFLEHDTFISEATDALRAVRDRIFNKPPPGPPIPSDVPPVLKA